MNINDKVAIVTGASGGIGLAVATELAHRGARAVALVDGTTAVERAAAELLDSLDRPNVEAYVGDVANAGFREQVFDLVTARHGTPSICVPAACATRDQSAVRVDAQTGCAAIFPADHFRHLLEINLIAPVYWSLELIARVAEQRKHRGLGRWTPSEGLQGAVVFIGSVTGQGTGDQIGYATAKAGLEGVETSLSRESIEHGVRCLLVHPDFTRSTFVRSLGDEFLKRNILPYLPSSRLNDPGEVAGAVCASIQHAGNSSGSAPLPASSWQWADVGFSLPV